MDCGVPEDRKKDASGREVVNLDPVSGKCVTCLVASVKRAALQWSAPSPADYDWQKAAAGDRE